MQKQKRRNAISNFNIPVLDFDRAVKFYSKLLDYDLQVMEFGGAKLGLFEYDHEQGGLGGALLHDGKSKPSTTGTIVYLVAGNDLQHALDRMPDASDEVASRVIVPKSNLGPGMGHFAIIDDSEGNRVGLYSPH